MSEVYTRTGEAADILRAFRKGKLEYHITEHSAVSSDSKTMPAEALAIMRDAADLIHADDIVAARAVGHRARAWLAINCT